MKRLAIFANARSGSSYLCDLLTQSGRFGIVEGFWIGPPHPNYAVHPYWQKRQGEALGAARFSWFYLDWWWSELHSFQVINDLLAPCSHILWLDRKDKAAQAVSWYVADHTKQWASFDGARAAVPPYNKAQIDFYYASCIGFAERTRAYLACEPDMTYEWLQVQEPQDIVSSILGFMGEDERPIAPLTPRHQRQVSATKADYVERYRATL